MNALSTWKQVWTRPVLCLAIVVAVLVGCKDATSDSNRPALNTNSSNVSAPNGAGAFPNTDRQEQPATGGTALKEPIAISAPEPVQLYEPKVVLSSSHEETCLVKVGDMMPDLDLKSLTGESVALKQLRGDGLTVVVFWTNRLAIAREQFQRLSFDVAQPLQDVGVKVVAVNVGDPAEQIELDTVAKDDIICVLDPDGSAVAKVATDKLPRTYLIDSEGHILWFDIGYSRTTRRQLKNAVFYYSREQNVDPS
jgi:peroxiredoxin